MMNDDQNKVIEGLTKITTTLFDEVVNLKQNNVNLNEQVDSQKNLIMSLYENQKHLMEALEKTKDENSKLIEMLIRSVNNVPYETNQGIVPVPKVASFEETVDKLVNERASIGRYGDGEISLMLGYCRQGFQKYNEKLSEKLREVIASNDDGFMVAIADNYGSLYKYDEACRNEVRYYMTEDTRRDHNLFLDMNRLYYNAHLTACYQMSRKEDEDKVEELYRKIKSIWKDRNVIIIEGALSRIGVGNDLLEGAKNIRRIICPPEHAFDRYFEILDTAVKFGKETEDCLFLVFLGPTATVLAYDLFKEGFQTLDLGHIDIDYEHYKHGSKDRIHIPGKHINNYNKIEDVEEVNDPQYLNQIAARINL